MKFKTVSEFIHALEVEGKQFESSYEQNYFVGWRNGNPRVISKDTLASYDFHEWKRVLTHDWQEYQPEPQSEPETEEIELEEVLADCEDGWFCTYWIEKGGDIKPSDFCNPIITGVTRKVKVPK